MPLRGSPCPFYRGLGPLTKSTGGRCSPPWYDALRILTPASLTCVPPTDTLTTEPPPPTSTPTKSLGEYERLKLELASLTAAVSGVSFLAVWGVYGLNIALSYLVGSLVGLTYLGLLARSVDRIGEGKSKVGFSRFGLLVALVLVAARWDSLQILPAVLGFLTYKAALVLYTIRTLVPR